MLTMVTCWIAGPAVVAAVIAAPAAVALNSATVRAMAGTAHTGIRHVSQVFPPSRLALLSLAALAIADRGRCCPRWASTAGTAQRCAPSGKAAVKRHPGGRVAWRGVP